MYALAIANIVKRLGFTDTILCVWKLTLRLVFEVSW